MKDTNLLQGTQGQSAPRVVGLMAIDRSTMQYCHQTPNARSRDSCPVDCATISPMDEIQTQYTVLCDLTANLLSTV